MEKQLRSALNSSPSSFLTLATTFPYTKSLRSALRSTLVHSLTDPAPLLPSSLLSSISTSLSSPPSTLNNPLLTLTEILRLCLTHPRRQHLFSDDEALLPPLRLLHDHLVSLSHLPDLQLLIASLCESYWRDSLPGRHLLLSQSLPFLLSRSLEREKKSDVRRVYSLRDAFFLFDLADGSSEDLRLLLARCAISPAYLKAEEGRKFLASALCWDSRLSREVLAVVRAQVPFGRKSVLDAYGDVLFRAWKAMGEGDQAARRELEDDFLQGMVEGAIHASSRGLATSIRRVLAAFVEQRTVEGINKLFFRLAEPLLFRSLQVANSSVRLNALHLLIDLFPLEDPDLTREDKHALLEKQFFLMEKLLSDDCPDVRAVDVEGICRILNLFWEVIPYSVISNLLAKVVGTMSHDTGTEVRISTVNGIAYLLDNPQSHEVLKFLLPRLGHLFLDPAVSVREAFTDLLLVARDIRIIQFNKVVNLTDLLSSLADDHSNVAKKIARFLLPSYFPLTLEISEACNRCIALIKSFPFAGARLCEFAFIEGAPLEALLQLLKTCIDMLILSRELNSSQIDGLFISCANICHSLSEAASSKKALYEVLSKEKMKCLMKSAKSTRSQSSFLSIASLFSAREIGWLKEHCLELIMESDHISDNKEHQEKIKTAHKLMISCGWLESLTGLLTEVLESSASRLQGMLGMEFPPIHPSSSKTKRLKITKRISAKLNRADGKGSSKSSMLSIEENYALAAAAAWQVKDLLLSEETRDAFLRVASDSALNSLRIISEVCITRCLNLSSFDISTVGAYMSLSLHVSLHNDEKSCLQSTEDSLQVRVLDSSLKHLVKCIEAVLSEKDAAPPSKSASKRRSGKSTKRLASNCSGGYSCTPKADALHMDSLVGSSKLSNLLRVSAAVLKFLCDSAATGLISFNEPVWLQYSLACLLHIKSILREHKEFNEEDFLCIKGSFTYAAKMLHVFFSIVEEYPSAQLVISDLANLILDIVALTETCLGPRYGNRIFSVAQTWLPDIVLGLCFPYLNDPVQVGVYKWVGSTFPEWLVKLGKMELFEMMSKLNPELVCDEDPGSETPSLKKLFRTMVPLLRKGNMKILEAVILVLLSFSKRGLDDGDIDFTSGLIHFICVKLLDNEICEPMDLELADTYMQELFSSIESELSDAELYDDQRKKLEFARDTLKGVISEV